ncbi:MAG: hypothetical protein COX88_02170 [Candidatus Nealsonbacteria bacterium CG_4_10_14_0_2_um_filter_35_20]|uniref:Uncharacterized protein n=1 Tax=Candidatus Nealsonbacteria bacterium CG11_big_fil_rev_8_21_14_0_20_35_11 TaxID=1974713 RepID=A0A2H0N1T5_9BACT|nr:MAG: hypothetical protein COV62_00060 [Candidatus Nealsonbacteria bacterium CG11_big_fil_rev_8_21_14_0_20_35_11]PIZ89756.1 MAG: hypothetical protein COX88_02170 [Candidatus Nealsonbacteria bacterium CG_4_10_14_0_2_um_filter_35_20]
MYVNIRERRFARVFIAGFLLLCVVVLGIGIGSPEEAREKAREAATETTTQKTEKPAVQEESQKEIVFDIPSLIRKNISEVKNILGKPDSEFQPTKDQQSLGILPTATYQKDGYEIQIDYLSSTGDVAEIFLAKNSNSKSELLRAGNVDENSILYSVKLQLSLRPDIAKYTGVHIYRWK